MKNFSWLKLVLSIFLSIIAGVMVTSLINLFFPISKVIVTLIAVLCSSIISALAGFFLGASPKKAKGNQ